MPNMKVYAITIEDAHGEYGRLYALADNDSDKLRPFLNLIFVTIEGWFCHTQFTHKFKGLFLTLLH